MRTIRSLFRYPIKGLSPEPLTQVQLRAGCGFPGDRELALTNGSWVFDAASYSPRPKSDFLMLMQHESLAALRSRVEGNVITVTEPNGAVQVAALDDEQALARLSNFFAGYLQGKLRGIPQVVRAGQHRFTDVSVVSSELMQSVSLINLASVRDLGEKMSRQLNPLRFRANIYFDGGDAWEELGWLDREIRLGDLRARVVLRTRRCAATNVDPERGVRDLGIPQALLKNYRHGDMGVYAELLDQGQLSSGDSLFPPN